MKRPKKLNLPLQVQTVVDQYKKHLREKYGVAPVRILQNGKVYYCIEFYKPERFLVVTEEGEVPPLEEVKPVINIASRSSGAYEGIDTIRKTIYRPLTRKKIKVHQKLLRLLEEFETEITFTDLMASYIKDFKKACRVTCDRYEKIRENYPVAEKEFDDIMDQQEITGEQIIKIQKIQMKLNIWSVEVDLTHLDTLAPRMSFIQKLKKQIPAFRVDLWIKYFQLRHLYKKMYNNRRVLESYRPYLQSAKRKLYTEINLNYYPSNVREIFQKTLNK